MIFINTHLVLHCSLMEILMKDTRNPGSCKAPGFFDAHDSWGLLFFSIWFPLLFQGFWKRFKARRFSSKTAAFALNPRKCLILQGFQDACSSKRNVDSLNPAYATPALRFWQGLVCMSWWQHTRFSGFQDKKNAPHAGHRRQGGQGMGD